MYCLALEKWFCLSTKCGGCIVFEMPTISRCLRMLHNQERRIQPLSLLVFRVRLCSLSCVAIHLARRRWWRMNQKCPLGLVFFGFFGFPCAVSSDALSL